MAAPTASIVGLNTKPKASENFGFPSHLIPPDKKNKEWCLRYLKAFHREHTSGGGMVLRNASAQYALWRAYANGKQPIDQYKDMLGVREQGGKRKPSWRNLDYSILPIVPRFKKIMVNKILAQPKRFKVKAIDQWSVNALRQKRNEIQEYMMNQEFLRQVSQQTGIGFESPIENDLPMPQNTQQLDLYMDIFPKQRHAVELWDELKLCFEVNDWEQVSKDVVTDIVEVGVGGTRTYLDSNGYIKIRRVSPERTICNGVEKEDFSDMIRAGEYVPMTISDLRQAAPKGTFTEKDLAAIATKRSGKTYSAPNMNTYDSSAGYPYDHEKVDTLWAQWFSADQWAHVVVTNPDGTQDLIKKDNPFWLEKAGYTDEQYKDFYTEQGEPRYVLRNEIKNVYQGVWIVDTEFVFNYGLKTNMARAQSSLSDTKLDYTFYSLNFDSLMRHIIPAADNAQCNWLHYQNHIANSRPDGLLIGKSAIGNVTLGGKGGLVLEPDDILRMYYEKGSYIYKDTDASGRVVQQRPIEFVTGGMSDAAERHLKLLIEDVSLIRTILGINELSDASTPNPDIGKDVAEQARIGTDIALGDLYYAYHKIFENTGKTVGMLVPDARKHGKNRGWVEALGEESQRYWEDNADMNPLDFSISLHDGFDDEAKKLIMDAATQSLKVNGGFLLPPDLYIIQNEENPDKAYMILEAKIRQRQKEANDQALNLQRENAKVQSESAQQVENAKRETLKMQQDWKEQDHQRAMELVQQQFRLQAMQTKLEKGLDLTADEKEMYNDLMRIGAKGKIELEKTRIMAEAKAKQQKAQKKAA